MNSRSITSIVAALALLFSASSCTKRARIQSPTPADEPQSQASLQVSTISEPQRININTASANELEMLPGIGQSLAQRIIEYREKYGPFRRPEHLIIIRGISDKRFRALRDLITVE